MPALTSAEIRKINEQRRAAASAETTTPKNGTRAGAEHRGLPWWVGPSMAALAVGAIYLVARLLGFDPP